MKQGAGINISWTRSLPVILQTEAAECGLACLAMIAGYHGLQTDLSTLRRRFSISLKGITLRGLIDIAKSMHMTGRPLKLDMEHLTQLQLPCVLHWDMSHFVVLKEVSGSKATIHDPGVGERTLSLEEFAKYFTGVALELRPTADFAVKNETQKFTLFGLMGRVQGLGRGLTQILLMAFALEIVAIASPFYMQWTVDHALVNNDTDLVAVLGLGFLLLVFIQTVVSALRSWMIAVLSVSLNFQWLSNVFGHLVRLPLEYFEKRHTGDIVSRFGSISTIQKALTTGFVQVIVDGVLVIGTLAMMMIYSVKLTLIAMVAVALYCILRSVIYRPLRDATTEQIVHTAKQQTHFMETARGIQSVRLFGKSEERRSGWMNILTDEFNSGIRIQKINISYTTANTFLFGVERVLVIWLAALAVTRSELSIGMLFAFLAYKDQFSRRMTGLVDNFFELKMLRLHGERVADIVLSDVEQESVGDIEIDTSQVSPVIEIRDLSYRYSPSEPWILQNINLRIEAGECIAIAGPSGCGKTTLVKLLLGLLSPTEGSVHIGDMPIHQLGLSNYRNMIGTVMQDDTLFSGSIAENISFFDPTPDQARIEMAARQAAIHEEIAQMPMAYNSLVGDIGSGMSGGQKQRVLLARALYKRPGILVLDEATSHLDVGNERVVNNVVKAMHLTRIIVAHRPETIAMAQRVVMLENGGIVRDLVMSEKNTEAERAL